MDNIIIYCVGQTYLRVAEDFSDRVRDIQDLAAAWVHHEEKSIIGNGAQDLENIAN